MTHKILGVVALLIIAALGACLVYQSYIIRDLIDLNHDKSVYIDGGCQGRYQGTEEMLGPQ